MLTTNKLPGTRGASPRALLLLTWRYPAFCGTETGWTSRKRMRDGKWKQFFFKTLPIHIYLYKHTYLSCLAHLQGFCRGDEYETMSFYFSVFTWFQNRKQQGERLFNLVLCVCVKFSPSKRSHDSYNGENVLGFFCQHFHRCLCEGMQTS